MMLTAENTITREETYLIAIFSPPDFTGTDPRSKEGLCGERRQNNDVRRATFVLRVKFIQLHRKSVLNSQKINSISNTKTSKLMLFSNNARGSDVDFKG